MVAVCTTSPVTIGPATIKTGKDVIRAQVRREMELEKRQLEQAAKSRNESAAAGPAVQHLDSAQVLHSCGGVFYTCSLLPKTMLPLREMNGTQYACHDGFMQLCISTAVKRYLVEVVLSFQ